MTRNNFVGMCFTCCKIQLQGMGKRIIHFGVDCSPSYNINWSTSCGKCPTKSLEMKWGSINNTVLQFCGNCHVVLALNENGSSSEDSFKKL